VAAGVLTAGVERLLYPASAAFRRSRRVLFTIGDLHPVLRTLILTVGRTRCSANGGGACPPVPSRSPVPESFGRENCLRGSAPTWYWRKPAGRIVGSSAMAPGGSRSLWMAGNRDRSCGTPRSVHREPHKEGHPSCPNRRTACLLPGRLVRAQSPTGCCRRGKRCGRPVVPLAEALYPGRHQRDLE